MSEPTGGSASEQDERWEALARYVAGESSTAEAAQIGLWLTQDPRRGEVLAALQRATTSLEPRADHGIDVEAALQRVSARLAEPPVHAIPPARRPTGWTAGLTRAAAVVVLLGAAAVVWRAVRDDPAPSAPALAERTFTAPVGAVDSLRLADGTRILLAPGSRLTVGADYGGATHEVRLAGEALFDVATAAAGRFTVRAGPAVIRDLGTTFSVRSDATEVRVVVSSGSVVLRGATATGSGTVLQAGDRGVLTPSGEVSAERGAASRDDLAWTDGHLVFNNATLAQVADELRRWYGLELQFADATLAARHVTARFEGEDAQHVLDVIALALDVEIERTSGAIAVVRTRR
jgi:transmembrane sensor